MQAEGRTSSLLARDNDQSAAEMLQDIMHVKTGNWQPHTDH